MMRKVSVGLMALATAVVLAQPAAAQGFNEGYMDIGPTVGFGNVGSANMAFGARLEKGLKPAPALGNGMIGIQLGFTYYSWGNDFFKYKVIPIGLTANYHFRLAESKIDPFLGLGLGYEYVSCSYEGNLDIGCGSSSVFFIGRAGVRYFVAPKLALYADVGAGGASVNVGVMFKMR